jgi:putative ABC transport system permease protein
MRWWRRRDREQDLERELRSDLELEAAEQQESGLSVEEARYAAVRALGNTMLVKEEVRRSWGWTSVECVAQDIRFSLRMFRKSPGFVLFAVIALALGLGANAAIFSVVDAVLLRPLPFHNADRLVEVWEDASHMGFPLAPLAPANFADWKRRNHVFEDMAALKGDLYALTGNGTPEQLEGSPVTANLFPLLGVAPILGRNFSDEEDRPGGARVVLISYSLWQRRFAGDPSIVGREIWLSSQRYQVIGVMPRGITFPEKSQIWLPLALGPREWALRDDHYLRVFARLKPGSTLATAQREMGGLAAQLAQEYPKTNTKLGAVVVSLRDQLVGNLRLALWAVTAGVGCVLLIACANLAGLLLARAAAREREFAVRAALGAGRARLIRQALIESLLLAGIGAGAGTLIAVFTLPFLRHLVPAALTAWSEPRIDLPLFKFLPFISVLAAILFGTLPALVLSRANLSTSLRQGGRVATGGSTRTRKMLIVSEVALAVVLLVGAGLLTRTLWALAHVPLGFRPEGVITLRTSLPGSSDSPYGSFLARSQFYQRVLDGDRCSGRDLGWLYDIPPAHQCWRHEPLHRRGRAAAPTGAIQRRQSPGDQCRLPTDHRCAAPRWPVLPRLGRTRCSAGRHHQRSYGSPILAGTGSARTPLPARQGRGRLVHDRRSGGRRPADGDGCERPGRDVLPVHPAGRHVRLSYAARSGRAG